MTRPPARILFLSAAAFLTVVLALAGYGFDRGYARLFFWLLALPLGAGLCVWAARRLLWRVSGRLAFSYFLIGFVPIPIVLLLAGLVLYGLAGFYLGHLYEDAVVDLDRRLRAAAAHHDEEPEAGGGSTALAGDLAFARYRDGRRVAGDPRAPEEWPAWLAEAGEEPAWVELPGGTLTLAAAEAQGPRRGTVAFHDGPAAEPLRELAEVWLSVTAGAERAVGVAVGGFEVRLGETRVDPAEAEDLEPAPRDLPMVDEESARRAFFVRRAAGDGDGWLDQPLLGWAAVGPRPRALATGEATEAEVSALLQASPRMLARSLFGPGAEIAHGFWIALLVLSVLLFILYAMAEMVAATLIVGLSRAVSALYVATERIRGGDFGVRIPTRRRDQVGALQRSFNAMAADLEDLVSTAAQKELLDKELAIAREVQQSLVPSRLPGSGAAELASLFDPSAAIGGDYFDVLRRGGDDDDLLVVVADVSGHGLPTGLRMAMVKAALLVLAEESRSLEEILRRLDGTIRAGSEDRFFVTLTLAAVDLARGRVEIANAGHPPTYLLRGGEVEEILLPSSPLGRLGHHYGRRELELAPDDVMVWLSDGLIEAADARGEPFGYERIRAVLAAAAAEGAGDPRSATAERVRDRLLEAVAAFTEGRPGKDDRTLVVMRYRGTAERAVTES